MNLNFLQHLHILDFTQRLPGPLGSHLLTTMGAKTIKLENLDIGGDSFQSAESLHYNPNFINWYKNINENKEIIQISFSKEQEVLQSYIEQADIILAPAGQYFEKVLTSQRKTHEQVIIQIAGGREEWKYLHDLNALSLSKSFIQHVEDIQSPPYLPIAGICFAQYISTYVLAAYIQMLKSQQSISQTVYLSEVVPKILDTIHSEQVSHKEKFLHNGKYPCYNVYQTKDHSFVCLAAIEEKFWNNFVEAFQLNLTSESRFDATKQTKEILNKLFSNLTSYEIRAKINNTQTCLSIISS